jgi:hypothetical protein
VRTARIAAPVLSIVAFSLLAAAPLCAQKTDTLTLRNGNRITGEIKELYRGKLSYSTDDMGTISIEWLKVAGLTSAHFFEFELGSGDLYFGLLQPAAEPGRLVVAVAEFSDTISVSSVVRIVPIETSFWDRLEGRIEFGFNLQKANTLTELSLDGNVNYRVQKASTGFSYSFYFQDQDGADATSRNSLTISHQRLLKHRWSALALTGLEQNTQLNLDLRYNLTAAGGYFFARTNKAVVQAVLGLAYTNEKKTDVEERTNNLEGVIGGEGAYFLFDSPKTDIDAGLVFYPNLTTWGRVRISFKVRLSYEILSDFTIGFTVFDEYDSGDPALDASNNDFGTSLSLGYKF